MKTINEYLNEQIDEALQLKVDKAVKDIQKAHKDDLSYIVIIPFDNEEMAVEIEQKGAFGPVATDCGKLYGIKL